MQTLTVVGFLTLATVACGMNTLGAIPLWNCLSPSGCWGMPPNHLYVYPTQCQEVPLICANPTPMCSLNVGGTYNCRPIPGNCSAAHKECEGGDFNTARLNGGTGCVADTNPQCCTWAKAGRCESNPFYMKVNCQTSCGSCGATEENADLIPTVLKLSKCE